MSWRLDLIEHELVYEGSLLKIDRYPIAIFNLQHARRWVSNIIQTRARDRPKLTNAGRLPSLRLPAPEDPDGVCFLV